MLTSLLFLWFSTIAAGSSSNPAEEFAGDISIDCGSAGNSTAGNGRQWLGDVDINSPYLLRIEGFSTTSTVLRKNLLISGDDSDRVPYRTARISRSQFSYAFGPNPGQKILRFHFIPAPYKDSKGFEDLFSVEVGYFTLLRNFSASLAAQALGVNSIVKEFCLYLGDNEKFDIVFSPLLNSYAFINGIEIISVPSSFSYFGDDDNGVQVVGQKSKVSVDYNTALELIHRLSVRQINDPSIDGFDHTYPVWVSQKLSVVKNSTWRVPVDVGFRYFVRLHFSGIALKIMEYDDLMFDVLINEKIVHSNVDIMNERDGKNIPKYVDYLAVTRGHKKQSICDLVISLHLYDEFVDGNGLVDGFEVFKLSNNGVILASPNPLPPDHDAPHLPYVYWYVITSLVVVVFSLVIVVREPQSNQQSESQSETQSEPQSNEKQLSRRFSLSEIESATRNFSHKLLIGEGGCGQVYKGMIDNGRTIVAIKRMKPHSSEGAHEFSIGIKTLSELRHDNLVSLIGYCEEDREMILVYDYMAGGTLADRLKVPQENYSSLTWMQRLNICIGIARGLDYLHDRLGIIHGDVKTVNILLDKNLVAKISDFGLAQHADSSNLKTVRGTMGYIDPHYIYTGRLTKKSDVYSFGVVLLEILCGRLAINQRLPENQRVLTTWARENINSGNVDRIVSSHLRNEVSENSVKAFVAVVERCLHYSEPEQRPTMAEAVVQLVQVLELQDT
ncbi:probable receptor-like protein kinase At5g38990 [Andrographis paniculata]|uniref:probable receptor-like protein kinase At5g38990 n=1 Tax=Andrographis paniculata TaxID=175694 RepID=UPI0021E902C1|nr:probable receptor-like protein kinase At5g38990 [Andrographis paniculata]XP_051129742.1 probable receptor-like protein kinase At5g38990 [Andrographis paniculata]XP_051129743.1 probable receptor-like protein kinase At5g38990 [Andrographis paniculata]